MENQVTNINDNLIEIIQYKMVLLRPVCEGVACLWREESGEEEDPGIQV